MNNKKLLRLIITNQKNIKFTDFIRLINCFGFILDRISGSHHIFKHPDTYDIINIQNVKGEVKPYQVKQFLRIVENNNLKFKE